MANTTARPSGVNRYRAGPSRKTHRGEHARDGERGDERRHGDSGRAVQGRFRKRHAFLGEKPVRVLDGHRRIVDQNADGESEAAERHGVERVAEEVERDERGQDRQRNGDHDHDGRAPGAEEQQDHQRGQRGGDNTLAHHARHRRFDEHRLVEQLADLEAWRRRGASNLQHGAHPVDDIEGRSVAVLDDAEQNGALAILADDVLLHRRAVANLADVLDEDRRAVGELDGNIVELVDRARRGVGAHGVLRVGDLHLARRQRQVLRIDRVHHVERASARVRATCSGRYRP